MLRSALRQILQRPFTHAATNRDDLPLGGWRSARGLASGRAPAKTMGCKLEHSGAAKDRDHAAPGRHPGVRRRGLHLRNCAHRIHRRQVGAVLPDSAVEPEVRASRRGVHPAAKFHVVARRAHRSPVTVPSPQFQNYVLSQLQQGGLDPVTGARYPAAPQLVPFYQRMFSLYRNTAGTPLPVLGCPLGVNGNGCANRQDVSQSSADHEQVFTARVDHNLSANNSVWYRFQADTGVQAAYTDPINPLFNATSPQPLYSFASGYTHLFSPSLVNYFNPAFSWYASLFGPTDPAKTLAAFPIVLAGVGPDAPFTTVGGLDNNWIQGRRAARFQVSDTLSWVKGRHEFKFGLSGRVLRLNDFDFSTNVTPLVTYTTLAQFTYGAASTATASYPVAASQPFNYLNLDLFALDTMRLSSTLTWTIGLRAAHNSNPQSPHHLIARLDGSFESAPHDANQPLDAIIHTGLDQLFPAT